MVATMAKPTAETNRALERQVEVLSNAALARGGRWFFLLAIVGVLSTGGMHLAIGGGHYEVPLITCVFLSFLSLLVWRTAAAGKLTERRKYLLLMPFVLSPHTLFFASWLLLPAGSATFLTGPFSFLLMLMIVLSGFVFDARFSMLAGIFSGALYFVAYLLGQDVLNGLAVSDPAFATELKSPAIWILRAFMIGFSGTVVATLTLIARKLAVSAVSEAAEKASISRLFGQYVSDEVKDKLIADKANLVGERHEVVILFSDLRGFSTFSEGKEPEEIVVQLNDYFDRMVEAIQAHGGVVDKFIGDAVMAVFGGLVPLDNPCQSAVDAATAMRVELHALNRRFAERGLQPFENGIGLHFGLVVQGSIGSNARKEFTVIGDAVNTSARLESACKDFPESVLLSDTVLAGLDAETRARCIDHGVIKVKGKAQAVPVFGLVDVATSRKWVTQTSRKSLGNP